MYTTPGQKLLGHYEVGEFLGRGGLSDVYKARDTFLDRWVALKFLQSWAVGHPALKARLFKEAKSASRLNHPNIVTIHEIAQSSGVTFIVMEYVPGNTLARLIPPGGFPLDLAADYAHQLSDALSAAEAAGILHGDLKPLNIMVTPEGRVKLLDFGLAWALASQPENRRLEMGTTVYMAPERLSDRQRPPQPTSEVFSFGLILHQLLSGVHPFGDGSRQETVEGIQSKPAMALPGAVPEALVRIVDRCLDKAPEHRFQSARELFHEVQRIHPLRQDRSGPIASLSSGSTDSSDVQKLIEQITYANVARSRRALGQLRHLLETSDSVDTRNAATAGLVDLLLTLEPYDDGVPPGVRQVRRLAMDVLKIATRGDLGPCFPDAELETLDLYAMDFSGCVMRGVSFGECFLAASDFENANLRKASFRSAWIRNVRFAGADLADADFTDADWFNAAGLTEDQLASVRPSTLSPCPPDVQALRRVLSARYGRQSESWDTEIREQLQQAWQEYLRPGGLRDLVARGRRGRQ